MRLPGFAAFCAGLAIACNSPNGAITVTVGGESDALSRTAAVASVTLEAVDRSGGVTPLADAGLPIASVDLGQVSQSLVATIQLTGKDSTANAVVFGATPFVEIGALDGLDVPLFVQRKGELARMPGTTADGRSSALLARTARGIYVAGGAIAGSSDPPKLDGYDLLFLQDFNAGCSAVSAVSSFAFVQLAAANVDGDLAVAYFLNSTSGLTRVGATSCANFSNFTLPGLTQWSDVAGGRTLMGDDGTAYIVGQTKSDAPSGTILSLDTSEVFSVLPVSTPRQGAASTWIPTVGIFLYGGSAAAKGVSIVTAAGGSLSHEFDSDSTQGLAAIPFDSSNQTVLVAGNGVPKTIDLRCDNNCGKGVDWGAAVPALTSSSLFAVGSAKFLLVGDDASTGATRVFLLDATSSNELTLKIPRQGARAIQTETGAVLIVGGGTSTIESFVL